MLSLSKGGDTMPIRRSNVIKVTIHPNIVKLIIQQHELSEFTEHDLFNIVSEHLKVLCDNKTIEKFDDDKYKLTPKGEELLKSSTDDNSKKSS